jgi:methyl-accepting chemotaxis protein
MTTTTQPLSSTSVEIADKTEAVNTIRDTLAVCDSLNELHETLRRLDYALDRKLIEKSLSEKKPFAPENNPAKKPDYKRCVILIIFVAVLITVFSLLVLNQMSSITVGNYIELLNRAADGQADYWRLILGKRLTQVHTIATILGSYGSEPAEIRQYWTNRRLGDFSSPDDEMVTLYTVWKPNAVDGMGQGAAEYFGESEKIEIIPAENTGGRDVYLLKVTAPIFNPYTNEVIGIIGCAYDLSETQKKLEKVLRESDVINAMEIYTGDGFIAASYESARIGKNQSNVEPLHNNMCMVLKPFTIENITWTIMLGATEKSILRGMNKSIRLTIIVTLIAIITASAAIFIVFHIMIKPIDHGNNDGINTPKKYIFLQRRLR